MHPNRTMSIAIVSGKGGVGKTNIALNLALALGELNHRVLLLDADLGLANVDVLLGIAPERTLHDLLHGASPHEVLVPLSNQVDLLPSASGVADLSDLDEETQTAFMERLTDLFASYDFLLMDLGAGIGTTVTTLAALPQERVVVITPEPTSLTDGYALIKILLSTKGIKNFHIVVNMAESEDEGQMAFQRLSLACQRFLELPTRLLGIIPRDPSVPDAVREQVPLLRFAPTSPASQHIQAMAKDLSARRTRLLDLIARSPILKPLPSAV
jgi:flagellar biosynthesis protein FlhG